MTGTVRFDEAPPPLDALMSLYQAVGWPSYVNDPVGTERAVRSSTYVVAAWDGAALIGLARVLSDEASVWFLQDVLVHPDRQRAGIGSALMARCVARFRDVRRGVLLTDPGRADAFYARFGFEATEPLGARAMIKQARRA